jgi:hypothetical protein
MSTDRFFNTEFTTVGGDLWKTTLYPKEIQDRQIKGLSWVTATPVYPYSHFASEVEVNISHIVSLRLIETD